MNTIAIKRDVPKSSRRFRKRWSMRKADNIPSTIFDFTDTIQTTLVKLKVGESIQLGETSLSTWVRIK